MELGAKDISKGVDDGDVSKAVKVVVIMFLCDSEDGTVCLLLEASSRLSWVTFLQVESSKVMLSVIKGSWPVSSTSDLEFEGVSSGVVETEESATRGQRKWGGVNPHGLWT